jgi:hypothetical protein
VASTEDGVLKSFQLKSRVIARIFGKVRLRYARRGSGGLVDVPTN